MNFFRRLIANVPGELLAARVATTSRHAETTTEPAAWVPTPEDFGIWEALAVVADSTGVIDYTTAAPLLPADAHNTNPEGTS